MADNRLREIYQDILKNTPTQTVKNDISHGVMQTPKQSIIKVIACSIVIGFILYFVKQWFNTKHISKRQKEQVGKQMVNDLLNSKRRTNNDNYTDTPNESENEDEEESEESEDEMQNPVNNDPLFQPLQSE